jgi:hypothetical protein
MLRIILTETAQQRQSLSQNVQRFRDYRPEIGQIHDLGATHSSGIEVPERAAARIKTHVET